MIIHKIAHRGYHNFYPENTLEAFEQAYKKGFTMIEMDVQLTRDRKIVIYHDTYIDNSMVLDLDLKQIKTIDSKILSLDEFFEQFDYEKITLYLDMKGADILAPYLVSFMITRKINTSNIYFASFNLKHLHYLCDYSFKLGFICENKLDNAILDHITNKYKICFVAFSWNNIDEEAIHFLHAKHKKVFVYTISQHWMKNELKHLDIDGFVSDVLIDE